MMSCSQEKIGYVDYEEVIKEFKGAIDAENEMKEESNQLSASLDQMAAEFQGRVQEYQQKMGGLSASAKAEQEQMLMQQQQQIQQQQQMAQQQIQRKGQEKMDSITEQIDEMIKSFAKKNGYSFILGTSSQTNAVIYGSEKSDITAAVIESLNEAYASKTEKVEESNQESTQEEGSEGE